jgi:hypothetical protein
MAVLIFLWSAVILLAVATLPALLLDAVCRPSRVGAWVGRFYEGHRAGRRADVVGPPIEQLAVQLRRLSLVLSDARPVSSVRRFGVERAYDETLAKACVALGIEHQLDSVSLADREFERLRVEAMLQEAGLVLRGPVGGCLPRREPRRHDGLG